MRLSPRKVEDIRKWSNVSLNDLPNTKPAADQDSSLDPGSTEERNTKEFDIAPLTPPTTTPPPPPGIDNPSPSPDEPSQKEATTPQSPNQLGAAS
jgi:hypothetical protein